MEGPIDKILIFELFGVKNKDLEKSMCNYVASMSYKITVYVYNGFGNSNCYLPFVSQMLDLVTVKYVNNLDFLRKKQHKPTDIVYFGGGRGKYVLENITGNQISDLKNNINHDKIRYIGICCGSYLASKQIIFDDTKKKSFGLCDVISVGPYYKKKNTNYDYSIDNSIIISNQLLRDERKAVAYLNGGGWFSNISNDFEIVSCYENSSLPSTIMNNKMFLSHIHVEHPSTNRIFSNLLYSFIFRPF